MANAAPYIAHPLRRLLAGAVDFTLCVVFLVLMLGIIVDSSEATNGVEVALLNRSAFLVYAAYHFLFYWLFRGQTPGLFLFRIRVVRSRDGGELDLAQAAARAVARPLAIYLAGWGAVTAHTIGGAVAAIVVAPLAVEIGMMITLPTRQTLSDVLGRTVVVNTPEPQPHRAPAAPMYSVRDAEFGLPPRHTGR